MNYQRFETKPTAGETPQLVVNGLILDVYLGGTVAAGDVVYFDEATGAFIAALGDVTGTSPVAAMALEAGGAGDTVKALIKGIVESGLTVEGETGSVLYLSEATAGQMSRVAPATAGNILQLLGLYADGTVVFNPEMELTEVTE